MPNTRSIVSSAAALDAVGAAQWQNLASIRMAAGPLGLVLELEVVDPRLEEHVRRWIVPHGHLTGSTVDDMMLSLDLAIRRHLVTDAGQELRLRMEAHADEGSSAGPPASPQGE